MAMYKKETVTVVGDLKQGDQGFDPATPKVKIRRPDGAEEAVPKAEVQS
jgi:hypothetical protein